MQIMGMQLEMASHDGKVVACQEIKSAEEFANYLGNRYGMNKREREALKIAHGALLCWHVVPKYVEVEPKENVCHSTHSKNV